MKTKSMRIFIALTILSLFVMPMSAFAKAVSPFVGHWEAIDVDGSDIRLTIAGPPAGPFKITWTESYFGYCNREAGIVKGTGWLREGDPYLLDADLHLTCFTTGSTLDFQVTWVYDPATDTIAYPEPNPVILTWHRPGQPLPWEWRSIIAHPDQEWVEGGGYPEGTIVSLRIFDSAGALLFGGTAVASYREGDPYFWAEFFVSYDLKAGDHLWMTDGRIAKDLIITDLQLTETILDYQSVSGTAEPGTQVIIEYPPDLFFIVGVDPDGNWTAIVEGLTPGIPGLASQEDADGDLTRLVFEARNPHFTVFPEWEFFDGLDWPDGATVQISVDGKPECYLEKESWGFFFNGNFPDGCDVAIGDTGTFTDDVTVRTHTVENLAITGVDKEQNTITGSADPGSLIYVWPHDSWFEPLQAVADSQGAWQVDLDEVGYDILEGAAGRSEIRDAMGNASAVEWYVPNPWFTAFPPAVVEGWNWSLGSVVHLTIDDPSTGPSPDFEKDGTSIITPWDPNSDTTWVWIEFPGEYDMKPGDVVTLSDCATERIHIVKNLLITSVDANENTVTGMSDGGENVVLWSWEDPQGRRLQVTADDSGQWMADFDETGFDLVPGYHVRAEAWDGVNDTAVDWYIPNPHFTVFPEWEFFDGLDWPDGATVQISVDGKSECYLEKESWGFFFNGNFPDGCDLATGDLVTFTDGPTTRTHTVQNLGITAIDKEAETISGIADAGAVVHVWPHATGEQLQATADDSGAWQVDFAGIFDLVPGEGGRAEIRDEVGNATAIDWYIPNPRIVASITENWFYLVEFSPEAQVTYEIYDGPGGSQVGGGTTTTDPSGFSWVAFEEHNWDLEPGNHLVITDGMTTKDLVIEGFTFDIFDVSLGLLQGTVPGPEGRLVWAGIGFANDGWSMEVLTDPDGNWVADFATPVPVPYDWVAAQIFDGDGDASELRPEQIVNGSS